MTWKHFFTSSVGKKYVMGLTGFFLIIFLIVHASVNSLIFANDKGATFNAAAHFLSHNILMRLLEVGLFVGIIAHAIQGLVLWSQNRKARPVKYKVNNAASNSHWYSRSMGLLGTLLLIFLVIHLGHFWVGTKNSLYLQHDAPHDLFAEMEEVFQSPIVLVIYLLGLVSLFFHLLHGFKSAFQSFGINHKRYAPIIKGIGIFYTIVICVLFACMPLSIYLKWLD